MIKFAHIRVKTTQETTDNNPSGILSRGGLTLAYEEKEDGICEVGVAYCSGLDNYCRAKGREIATERLGIDPFKVNMKDGFDKDDFVNIVNNVRGAKWFGSIYNLTQKYPIVSIGKPYCKDICDVVRCIVNFR